MPPRDRKEEIVDPKDDHLNSGDVRNLKSHSDNTDKSKWYWDNIDNAKKVFRDADDLEEMVEARKWRNRTQKYVRAVLVFIAAAIATVGSTIAILDKWPWRGGGPHP